MALPLLATPDDVRGILKFLSRKPAGASLDDAQAILGEEFVDPRKVAAYQRLGILTRENDHLKLTPTVGRDLARATELQFPARFRTRVGSIAAYNGCLEWAYERELTELTTTDVGAFWHDHHSDELGTTNERQITERANCFLRLCEGAGLGTYLVGRRGQATRLDVDRDALEAFVHSAEFAEKQTHCENGHEVSANGDSRFGYLEEAGLVAPAENKKGESAGKATDGLSVLGQAIFVGHGKNKTPLSQLRNILNEFKIPFKVVTEEPNLGRPISEKVAQTMKECNCAILIFTADEEFSDKEGNSVWRPSENVIHELGAASFLYGKRIVVLKEDCVQLPTNFRDIGYISFSRDDLAAKTMDVLKELIGFGIVKITT
jgi:predicted nucleotide-binding protein